MEFRLCQKLVKLSLSPTFRGNHAILFRMCKQPWNNTSMLSQSRICNYHRTVPDHQKKQIIVPKTSPKSGEITVGEKVKQAGKDATYTGVIILGVAVTGVMAFAIGRELLSSQSPSGVFNKALKQCRKHEEIIFQLGEPIKGFGETTRRGRRRHTSHMEFEVEGVKHMRMKFYIQGPKQRGTVHLEVKKNESGKYENRYLFVQLEEYPRSTIILEDNR